MTLQPSEYIIGTIIFTMITLGVVAVIMEVQNVDNGFIDAQNLKDFNQSFNHYNELTNSVNGLQTSVTGSEIDQGGSTVNGVLNSLLNTIWTTLKMLFSSFAFMTTAYNGLVVTLGVPSWLPILIGLIVSVIFAFGIFAAVTRTNL
jgi:hypothetical protein